MRNIIKIYRMILFNKNRNYYTDKTLCLIQNEIKLILVKRLLTNGWTAHFFFHASNTPLFDCTIAQFTTCLLKGRCAGRSEFRPLGVACDVSTRAQLGGHTVPSLPLNTGELDWWLWCFDNVHFWGVVLFLIFRKVCLVLSLHCFSRVALLLQSIPASPE